jgi:hypothetical protein
MAYELMTEINNETMRLMSSMSSIDDEHEKQSAPACCGRERRLGASASACEVAPAPHPPPYVCHPC